MCVAGGHPSRQSRYMEKLVMWYDGHATSASIYAGMEAKTMWNDVQVLRSRAHPFTLRAWSRVTRSVQVRVIQGGREVDSFQASHPATLRAALAPICRYLSAHSGTLQFLGVESRQILPGLPRRALQIDLANLESALEFLQN